jgi:DNA primase
MRHGGIEEAKQLPIKEVAARLGIKILRGNKAMCFGGHDSRTPSLSFVPTKNIWKCFGCGRKGDVIGLVMQCLDLDFKTALEWFAEEFHLRIEQGLSGGHNRTKGRLNEKVEITSKLSRLALGGEMEFSPDPELYAWFTDRCGPVSHEIGTDYLRKHGIEQDVANRFSVRELRDPTRAMRRLNQQWGAQRVFQSGLAWGNHGVPERLIWSSYAILFPISVNGVIRYIQGRLFRKGPKYLNLRGIPKPLYNIDRLLSLRRGSIIHLCEGIPDALALETHGLATVAVLGASSFRAEWVDDFIPYDIVLVPDGDSGGETFRRAISEYFWARGKAVRIVRVPAGKDAAEVMAEMGRTA